MPTSAELHNDPMYIGPQNWTNLQGQYTQNQLSQATTRKWNTNSGQYDIYWNPAVNIANIPREMQVPTNTGNVTPSNGSTTTISGGSSGNIQDQIMSMFGSGQASGYDAMSMLMQQRDAMLNQQQQQQQGLYDQYNTQLDSALNRNMWGEYQTELQRQGYDEKLGLLNNYNAQLRDLTLDYQMGRQTIRRESRLESMTKGRMSNIYEQYANEATLINNNIAGVQGQIDRIEKNTEKFFDFLQIQNQNVIDNLTSLRDMAGQNIISLSKEERESIDTRLSIIQNQLESNERERDAKRQLIMEAYQSGLDLSAMGVNLADDYETLMSKIGPAYRAEMLRQESMGGSGGAGGESPLWGGIYSGITDKIKQAIANGKTPAEAVEEARLEAQRLGIEFTIDDLQTWRNYAEESKTINTERINKESQTMSKGYVDKLLKPKKTKSWNYTNPSNLANPNDFYANLFGY